MNIEKEKDIRDIQWDRMYELAKVYYENSNNLDIPIEFSVKNSKDNTIIPLGS